ncbi:unnamed protein product [Arabidopsis lyrata]|nr:unnamed protein product [Arabidopsis lyrata]
MFVLTIEILVLHLAKTSTSFSIDGDIFLLSPIVSFGLRETLLGFKTRINRRLDEPVSLPQSSQEELNLVIQRGLWLFVDWMITIHRWPPNIQDEVLKLISIWIKEWRIHDEYLREHIIGVIEKANQAIEDYSFISNFDQHVIEVHDLVAEKLHHIKATYSKGHFIESAIIVVLWYREFFGINKRKIQEKEILLSPRFAIEHGIYLCPVLDLLSNIYWLQWKHSLWQQPRERKQWIYPDEHRRSMLDPSSTLISMRQQVPESFPTTFNFTVSKNVVPMAFWSFSYKLIANKKCVKGGHNRLYLLAYKSKDSMVTLHSFFEIVIISCICVNGCLEMIVYLVNTF